MKRGFLGGLSSKLRGKRSRRGGFTLAELLIVVQIISILVAMSIPYLNEQPASVRDAYNTVAGIYGASATAAQPVDPQPEADADVPAGEVASSGYGAPAAAAQPLEEATLYCAHEWGSTQYEWSKDYTKCTAVSVCAKCKMKDKVSAKKIEKKLEEKCEEPGSATYTATFEKASLGDSVTVEIPALGHDWGKASYQWSAGRLQCTGTCECKRCHTVETQTKTAELLTESTTATCEQAGIITVIVRFIEPLEPQTTTLPNEPLGHDWGEWTVVTEPTCTQPGVKTHTCQRAGCGATETADVPALGHDWTTTYTWSADHDQCTAERACGRCGFGENTTVKSTAEGIPACTQAGKTTYTATFAAPFETQTKTVDTEKLGHNWGTASYEWSADYATCKATRTCQRDKRHVETKTVNAAAGANTATCEAAGTITYTAGFAAPFETQTKTVETEKLGHTGGTATCTAKAVCTRCQQAYGEKAPHTPGKKYFSERNDGYHWRQVCSVCGDDIESGVIPYEDENGNPNVLPGDMEADPDEEVVVVGGGE